MPHITLPSQRIRILAALSLALIAAILLYLSLALYSAYQRYSAAVAVSEGRAHTILGKEGYEYIFEPSTQLLVDKIKPQGREISIYIMREDYLPTRRGQACTFPDPDICLWMAVQVFQDHDPAAQRRAFILSAVLLGLGVGGGFYLLTKVRSSV
jgi:hypothetical protein